MDQFPVLRKGIRRALGAAIDLYGWADREIFSAVYGLGIDDADSDVREAFLRAAHSRLASKTVETAQLLLKAGASQTTLTHVLKVAAGYRGQIWGQGLEELEAGSVLRLIDQVRWRSRDVQEIASGIASRFPQLLLDHLLDWFSTPGSVTTQVEGLTTAFKTQAAELVDWIVEQAQLQDRRAARLVCSLVFGSEIEDVQASALIAASESLEGPSLLGLVDLLGGVPTWPLRQPELARQLLVRAGLGSPEESASMLDRLRDAMRVTHWTFANGVSQELERAHAAAARLAESEPNLALRAAYAEAARVSRSDVDGIRLRYEADDD
jgi:hypothetical protein